MASPNNLAPPFGAKHKKKKKIPAARAAMIAQYLKKKTP